MTQRLPLSVLATICGALFLGTGCSNNPSGTTGTNASGTGATSGRTSSTTSGSTSGVSSSSGGLGATCNNIETCSTGLTCEQIPELNGGFCTEPCAQTSDCSGGSCAEILPGEQYCIQTCTTDSDCSRALFGCDPTCQICIPEAAFGQVSCAGHVVGSGGHNDAGGACQSLPTGTSTLTWSASVDVSSGPLTYAEAEGALSNDGAGHLVAAYMVVPDAGSSDAGSPFNWLGLSTSANDGALFTVQPPIISSTDSQLYDPSFARDTAGNTYLAYAGLNQAQSGGELYLATSANNGGTWGTTVNALPAEFDPIDKPFMAINPTTELPVFAFADIQGSFGAASRIGFVNETALNQFDVPVDMDDGVAAAFRDLPSLAFDNNGRAYAAWVEVDQNGSNTVFEDQATGTVIAGSTSNTIQFATFVPGALTSAPPNTQVSAAGEAVVVDSPRVAVASDGSETYVAYVVATADNATDIRVAASADQGSTWTTDVTVDDLPGCATHFHPAIFVDGSGTVWVSWVDNRDGQGHVFYASSTNQGASFGANALLSDTPFYFTTLINSSNASVPAWLGAYQFLGGDTTELYALWTADTGGMSATTPAHLYFSKATLP